MHEHEFIRTLVIPDGHVRMLSALGVVEVQVDGRMLVSDDQGGKVLLRRSGRDYRRGGWLVTSDSRGRILTLELLLI